MMRSETKMKLCCQFIQNKKGRDLVCLDLRGVTSIADFFIICTGDVNVHIRAIADEILDGLRQQGARAWHTEGYAEQRWILIDLVDVVIHVFCDEARKTYELEKLWGDAKRMEIKHGEA